jgi:hypothetical protein
MSLVRQALGSTKARIILTVAGLVLVWQVWLSLAAPFKLAPGIARDAGRVNVVVTLSFPPERFHIEHFQALGRVSGTDGPTVEVRGVPPANLRAMARPFWVRRVDPLNQGG